MAKTYSSDPQHGRLRVEVQADRDESWAGNGLRFDEVEEAKEYARDLFSRWTAVREWRVIDTEGVVHATSVK